MSGHATVFKWHIPILKYSERGYKNGTPYYIGSSLKIVLKEKKKEEPIKLNAKVWLEDKDGMRFVEGLVETHTFKAVNDECVFYLSTGDIHALWQMYSNESSVSFWCQLEDPWNASHQRPLSQMMWELHNSGLESDAVTLQVNEKNVEVSQNVLMAHSNVFKSMFTSNFEESHTKTINIKDVEAPVIEALVEWMYLKAIRSKEVVESLFALADKYMIPDLKAQCSEILPHCLTEENAAHCLVLSIKYKDEEFKNHVTEFIHQKGPNAWLKVLQSDAWIKLVSEQRSIDK